MSKTYQRLNELLLSGLYFEKALDEVSDVYGIYNENADIVIQREIALCKI